MQAIHPPPYGRGLLARKVKTGKSLTGLYFVRQKQGPIIAFLDETFKEGLGSLWEKHGTADSVFYFLKDGAELETPDDIRGAIKDVIERYSSLSDKDLTLLGQSLPA